MEAENISPSSASSGETFTSSSPPSSGFYNCVDYTSACSTIQGLPKQFVKSMRTLFNILDDNKSGLVPLVEIERRWRDDAVPNLPGVLCALRDVAPPDGLLTFENFVCGLRMALTRARGKEHFNRPKNFGQRNERNGLISSAPVGSAVSFKPFHRPNVRSINVATVPPSWSRENTNRTRSPPPIPAKPLQCRDNYEVHLRPRERPLRSNNHRRSSSGPISTAKVLPHIQNPVKSKDFESQDDIKLEKVKNNRMQIQQIASENTSDVKKMAEDMRYPTITKDIFENRHAQINDHNINEVPCSKDDDLSYNQTHDHGNEKKSYTTMKSFGSAESIRQKSDLDQMTASTLCINKEEGPSVYSMQPVILSGKYIGITGTLKRTKSSACITQNQCGSLRRSPKETGTGNSPPQITSMSATCFSTLGRAGASGRNAKIILGRKMNRPQNSKSESNDVMCGISTADRKRAMSRCESSSRNRFSKSHNSGDAGSDGSGRRCNSASPPERPAIKSARSSDSPDQIEIPKLALSSSPESNLSRSATSPNISSESEPRGLSKPPLPGRNSNSRNDALSERLGNQQTSNPKCQERSLSSSCVTSGGFNTERRRRANSASSVSRRRDPRRHTVTTGIDYNLLKCMKQMEEEKDLLMKGIESANKAKELFEHKLEDLKDRQNKLDVEMKNSSGNKAPNYDEFRDKNSMPHAWSPSQLEKSQRKLDSLLTSVTELINMTNTLRKDTNGFVNVINSPPANNAALNTLKEQNQLLTKEVSGKSLQIGQLEKEKSVLVQQLFQARAEIRSAAGDQVNTSIFI